VEGRQSVPAFLISGKLSYPVRLRDLSTCGAGFYLNRAITAGAQLQLEVTNKSRLFTCRRVIRVAHSTPLQHGIFLIG
jgi:hypothetical protein